MNKLNVNQMEAVVGGGNCFLAPSYAILSYAGTVVSVTSGNVVGAYYGVKGLISAVSTISDCWTGRIE